MADMELKADLVRGLRKALGLTQPELAERLEVSLAALRTWEDGKGNPGGVSLLRLILEIGDPDDVEAARLLLYRYFKE